MSRQKTKPQPQIDLEQAMLNYIAFRLGNNEGVLAEQRLDGAKSMTTRIRNTALNAVRAEIHHSTGKFANHQTFTPEQAQDIVSRVKL